MQTYPVDLCLKQIVRWVMAELRATPSTFRISARRATELREIPTRKEIRLGDQEREDVSEIATIATQEIAPFHSSDRWRLTVVVEDDAGPRAPGRSAAIGGGEESDLGAFYEAFVRPGRGSVNVTASRKARVGLMSWPPLQALARHARGAAHEKLERHHQHLSGWLPARNPRIAQAWPG